jgi:hypothetical protein
MGGLQGDTHQADDYVVETGHIRGAVRSFQSEEDLSRSFVNMQADIERPLSFPRNFPYEAGRFHKRSR